MTVAAASSTELVARLRTVPRPLPVLARDRERQLTDRQREILDTLSELFDSGFADLTMAEIAGRANCSLRTLYTLAPSRDELVLIVVDRMLWRVGRSASGAIDPAMAALDALTAYLQAATEVVDAMTAPFARDLSLMPAAQRLAAAHEEYTVAVATALLDLAVESGEISPVDTAAVARVMASVALLLSRPEISSTLSSAPKPAADSIVAIMVAGMRHGPPMSSA